MSISKVGQSVFYMHPNLERAVVSAPVIESYAFQGASKLETVDLTSTAADIIDVYAFGDCTNLTHLVVRSTARSSLSATSALSKTKINIGDGGIYVPADLLESYKSATNWSTFAANIYPIGEYPRANFDTISDSWSDIFANPDYATDYAVKDTKMMELTDGTKIKMNLAAINTDVKADNSGNAKMTWITQFIVGNVKSQSDDWGTSPIRNYLINNFLSKIPEEIKNHIVKVKKTYRNINETKESVDDIWIPSCREVCINDSSSIEDNGCVYSAYFTNAADRCKINVITGSASAWATRTVTASYYYKGISDTGGVITNMQAYPQYFIFGFCTD